MNHSKQQRAWIIPLLPDDLPGKVIDTFGQGHYKIKCLIEGLPLEDGSLVENFVALKHTVVDDFIDINNIVIFNWSEPGQRSFDPTKGERRDPKAVNVRQVNSEEAEKLAFEIRNRIGDEIRRNIIEKHEKEQLTIQNAWKEINLAYKSLDSEIKDRLDKSNEILEKIRLKNEELELEQQKLSEAFVEVERKQKKLQPYNILATPLENKVKKESATVTELSLDFANSWTSSLQCYGCYVSEVIARSYLISIISSLYLGRFVLLNGTVGVGKTSIVKHSAKVLGGESNIIPIRPAWLDPSDLIGFYDPIQEIFRPAPFLTAIKNAKENKDNFYLVCLDEINLAKIENYGADLLSCLEYSKKTDKPEELLLYSQDTWQNLREECEYLYTKQQKEQKEFSGQEKRRLTRLQRFFNEYPSYQFQIPDNLVLIGTLNSDETTYDLSPKFIDRSFVLTYPPANLLDSISNVFSQHEEKIMSLSVESVKEKVLASIQSQSVQENFQDKLLTVDKWNKSYFYKSELGRPLGYRVKQDLEVFMAVSKTLGFPVEEGFGHFLFTKILPRVYFFKNEEANRSFREWLNNELEDYEQFDPAKVIDKLGKQLEDSQRQVVSYWS